MFRMTERNHKKQTFENPVGNDTPFVKFDVPLWQVFVALILIACVLTGFKAYERRYIAPQKKVQWKPFDLREFKQERLSRRNILLWIHSSESSTNQAALQVFEQVDVRVAVYLRRCLAFEIRRDLERDENLAAWLDKHAAGISKGGIGYWIASSKEPEFIKSDDIDIEAAVRMIDP